MPWHIRCRARRGSVQDGERAVERKEKKEGRKRKMRATRDERREKREEGGPLAEVMGDAIDRGEHGDELRHRKLVSAARARPDFRTGRRTEDVQAAHAAGPEPAAAAGRGEEGEGCRSSVWNKREEGVSRAIEASAFCA
eukprot:2294040-Rhodomonas_salina.1